MRLKAKVAIVTGAASGIGKATALLFSQEGAKVVCADIDGQGATLVARQIGDVGGEAEAIQVDVSVEADARRTIETTVQRFGRLDILVNNAGVEMGPPVTLVEEPAWDRLMDVNLKGVFLGCKHAIAQMVKMGGGAIVNTASGAGLRGIPMLSAYSASKGASSSSLRPCRRVGPHGHSGQLRLPWRHPDADGRAGHPSVPAGAPGPRVTLTLSLSLEGRGWGEGV